MSVYVVQKQMRYDHDAQKSVPRFPTITKAERFGEIKYCLSPNEHPFNMESAVGNLHDALSGFCDDDFLILVGSPILLGCATAIAGYYNEGRVKFLQWSAREDDYVLLQGDIY